MPQYAHAAGADWKQRAASPRRSIDFPTLNARSKFWGDDSARRVQELGGSRAIIRNPLDERQGIHERILLRELLRRVEMKVIQENKLDVVVRLHTPLPPAKIGLARSRAVGRRIAASPPIGPNAGLTEVLIPAGLRAHGLRPDVPADLSRRQEELSSGATAHHADERAGAWAAVLARVLAEPGMEDLILKVASAYQARVEAARAATRLSGPLGGTNRHRTPRRAVAIRRRSESPTRPENPMWMRRQSGRASRPGGCRLPRTDRLQRAERAGVRFQLGRRPSPMCTARSKRGQITCRGIVQAYIESRAAAYNGVPSSSSPRRWRRRLPARTTAQYKAAVPDGHGSVHARRRSDEDAADRVRTHGADRVRPAVQQQYGMTVGIPNAGQVRALGMLNIRGERSVTCKGDFDRHPSSGPLPAGAPEVCEEFRKHARRAGTRRGAGHAVRPQSGPRGDADVLHPVLVQGSVRHQGHAVDRRRRCALRHRLPGARSDAGGAAAAQGRHHLRQGEHHRIQRPGGQSRAAKHYPTKVLPPTLGYQRSTWAGNPSNVYDTTRAASIGSSSGSGVSRERQSRDVQPVRGDRRVVPRSRQPQLGGADPAAQGDALLPRRRHRLRHLSAIAPASSAATSTDSAKVLDALKDPVNGYYDPRDIFTTVPRSSLLARAVRLDAITTGHAGRA